MRSATCHPDRETPYAELCRACYQTQWKRRNREKTRAYKKKQKKLTPEENRKYYHANKGKDSPSIGLSPEKQRIVTNILAGLGRDNGRPSEVMVYPLGGGSRHWSWADHVNALHEVPMGQVKK